MAETRYDAVGDDGEPAVVIKVVTQSADLNAKNGRGPERAPRYFLALRADPRAPYGNELEQVTETSFREPVTGVLYTLV